MNKETEVSPCCKADFEESEGTACCNARLSETGLCYECKEHSALDGYWCLECDENFEEPVAEETEDGMTKEVAIISLNNYIKKYGIPIKDVVICEDSDMSGEEIIYTDWTFKGLLCLVYDDLEIKK